jgi:hypothetical protein
LRTSDDRNDRAYNFHNRCLGSPITAQTLEGTFDALWPKLEAKLSSLPGPESDVPDKRKMEDMVAEILNLNRTAAKRRESVEKLDRYLPTLEVLMRFMEANVSTLSVPLPVSGVQNAPGARVRAKTPTSWPEPVEGKGIPEE